MFVDDVGHENPVYPFFHQVVDVPVDQFGREADVVRHDIVDAAFIVFEGGGVGQLDLQPAACKQGVPEGVVLVNVQAAGNANGAFRVFLYRPVKEQLVFVFVDVFPGFYVFPVVGEEFFAFVSGEIGAAVGKIVFFDQAVVFAAVALELAVGIGGNMEQFVQGHGTFGPASGKQGAAVGSHDFRDIAPVHGGMGQ